MAIDLSELRSLLGAHAVLGPDDGIERYQTPARGQAGVAAFVVRPATIDEVRAVVRWAFAHRVRLVAQGANTGLVGGSVPDATGTVGVLNLDRLVDGLVVDPVDRTAIVPAGMRLSALEAALAPHGLTFPIDLSADPSIGGMVATNTGGSRMLAYGDVRARVLGLEVVLPDADATVLDLLRPLRKDNAGLALQHLFIGADGALGVVTRAALELAPRPRARATAWVAPSTDAAVVDLLLHFEGRGRGLLTAFELVSGTALGMVLAAEPDRIDPFAGTSRPDIALLVEFSGDDDVEAALLDALHGAPTGSMDDARIVPPAQSWGLRHGISPALAAHGHVVGLDVSTPRSRLPAFRREARALVEAVWPDARVADFGHAGDGGLHFNLVFPFDRPLTDAEHRRIRAEVYRLVARHEGSFSAEHGIGPMNAQWWEEHVPPAVRRVTADIAALLDPAALLGHPDLPYRSTGTPDDTASS